MTEMKAEIKRIVDSINSERSISIILGFVRGVKSKLDSLCAKAN